MGVVEDNVAFLASRRGLRYALRDLRMDVTLDSSTPLGWRAITWSVPLRFSDRTGLLYKIGESVLVAQQADDRTLKSASLIARMVRFGRAKYAAARARTQHSCAHYCARYERGVFVSG